VLTPVFNTYGKGHNSEVISPRRMPLKKMAYLLLILNLMSLLACSTHVSSERVSGTYLATYPFGKAVLVLQTGGKFVQTVEVNGESAIARGSWSFDSQNSKITLLGIMPIVDGFGHLERNWRNTDDLNEQPVERLWLKIEIETNESYGYVKL
jgi:hypothetical protein